jgi:hypothetical protein
MCTQSKPVAVTGIGAVIVLWFLLANGSCAGMGETAGDTFGVQTDTNAIATLELMIQEAQTYALRLGLPEELPITRRSLTECFLAPSEIARQFGCLGSFRTKRFSYGFDKGQHLCYITRLVEEPNKSLYERYKSLAIGESAVNTNGAFTLATQWLAKAFVDVPRLNRSSTISVEPVKILDITVAIYDVSWRAGSRQLAEVVLVEPTAQLRSLEIKDPQYIQRPSIPIKGDDANADCNGASKVRSKISRENVR